MHPPAMDGLPLILVVAAAATVPIAVAHELTRGLVALALTPGRVCVLLGQGRALTSLRVGRLTLAPTARWWWGSETLYDPLTSSRRATAIHLAGPLAADLCFVVAAAFAIAWPDAPSHDQLQLALFVFALVALVRASAELLDSHGRSRAELLAR